MQIGEVVSTKNIKAIIQDGDGWLSYKLPKNKAYVFMLLGVEDIKGGEKLDFEKAEKVMNALGWYRKGE